MERVDLFTAAQLALIYNYRVTGTDMVKKENVFAFQNAINENLDNMNSSVRRIACFDDPFCFYAEDSCGNGYYIFKPEDKYNDMIRRFIMFFPLDVIVASQKNNALETLNIIVLDGKMILKNDHKKNLIKI